MCIKTITSPIVFFCLIVAGCTQVKQTETSISKVPQKIAKAIPDKVTVEKGDTKNYKKRS